ncbi:hypothetical protein ACWCOT_44105 [Nonomuraea bangladeshensis]
MIVALLAGSQLMEDNPEEYATFSARVCPPARNAADAVLAAAHELEIEPAAALAGKGTPAQPPASRTPFFAGPHDHLARSSGAGAVQRQTDESAAANLLALRALTTFKQLTS